MTRDVEAFIELINCSLYGNIFSGVEVDDLLTIRQMSVKNSLSPFCYNGIMGWEPADTNATGILSQWKQEALLGTIGQMRKDKELLAVLNAFTENEIKYALFKGMVLSVLYPKPNIRYSSDSDIWVDETCFDKAHKLLTSMGFVKDEMHSKDCVFNYSNQYLYIEMHKFLWEDYTGKKIDKIKELNWTDSNKFVKVSIGSSEYDALGYTEHLEFMFFHTIKHYVYSGFGIRHLVDVVVYVNKHIESIDIDKFWNDMETLGYSTFCLTALNACIKYLGMDKRIVSGKSETPDEFLEKFILAAIDSGTFGNPLVRVTKLDSFYDEGKKDSKTLRSIFPPYKEMCLQFEMVRKCCLLLPIAWIYRLGCFAFNPKLVKAKKENLKSDELRQQLIHELELQ